LEALGHSGLFGAFSSADEPSAYYTLLLPLSNTNADMFSGFQVCTMTIPDRFIVFQYFKP